MRFILKTLNTGAYALAMVIAFVPMAGAQAPMRPSTLKCEPARLPGPQWAECLRKAEMESEKALTAALEHLKKVAETRADLFPPQRVRLKRVTDETQALWVRFRNAECQEVAPLQVGPRGRIFEERLACIIDHNARRETELTLRAAPR